MARPVILHKQYFSANDGGLRQLLAIVLRTGVQVKGFKGPLTKYNEVTVFWVVPIRFPPDSRSLCCAFCVCACVGGLVWWGRRPLLPGRRTKGPLPRGGSRVERRGPAVEGPRPPEPRRCRRFKVATASGFRWEPGFGSRPCARGRGSLDGTGVLIPVPPGTERE